jgi:UDP-N-acetylmuramate--alanine ligase
MKSFLNKFKEVYILGIGGSGMSSIAKFLHQSGVETKGYDQRASYVTDLLNNDGLCIEVDISEKNFDQNTLYIVSSAIKINDTFLKNYIDSPNVLTRPEFLNEITKHFNVIGITGTHGKTSSTALLAHIYNFNNIPASYIFGGITSFGGVGGSFAGYEHPLILETDEAFNTFENLDIDTLLVTNIDHDHIDHYGTFENLVNAFKSVISNVKNSAVLNIDDKNLKMIFNKSYISYSKERVSDFQMIGGNEIVADDKIYKINSKLIGEHFISNITGVIALAKLNGISIEDSLSAIEHFDGVKRRSEFIGEFNGIKVYDDYAHHPTEILSTINSFKKFSDGRLITIFQPHRYTRTENNFTKLKESLEVSDITIVTDIYSAGEKPIPGVNSSKFSSDKIKYLKSPRMVPHYLKDIIKKGDLILTLGAGDITLLGPQVLKYFNEKN